MAKDFTAYQAFIAERAGHAPDFNSRIEVSPDTLLSIFWPLNDVFRPHIEQLKTVRYRASYARKADKAIRRFAETGGSDAWARLDAPTWRVLLERHRQMLTTCAANLAAGNNIMFSLPSELAERDRLPAAMLYWLHGMELPFPLLDQSELELPEAMPGQSISRH